MFGDMPFNLLKHLLGRGGEEGTHSFGQALSRENRDNGHALLFSLSVRQSCCADAKRSSVLGHGVGDIYAGDLPESFDDHGVQEITTSTKTAI